MPNPSRLFLEFKSKLLLKIHQLDGNFLKITVCKRSLYLLERQQGNHLEEKRRRNRFSGYKAFQYEP